MECLRCMFGMRRISLSCIAKLLTQSMFYFDKNCRRNRCQRQKWLRHPCHGWSRHSMRAHARKGTRGRVRSSSIGCLQTFYSVVMLANCSRQTLMTLIQVLFCLRSLCSGFYASNLFLTESDDSLVLVCLHSLRSSGYASNLFLTSIDDSDASIGLFVAHGCSLARCSRNSCFVSLCPVSVRYPLLIHFLFGGAIEQIV